MGAGTGHPEASVSAQERPRPPLAPSPIHAQWRWHDGGVARTDSEKDHGCSRCGRRSHSVTLKELGDWIVDVDSTLICSDCCADAETDSSVDRRTTRHTA